LFLEKINRFLKWNKTLCTYIKLYNTLLEMFSFTCCDKILFETLYFHMVKIKTKVCIHRLSLHFEHIQLVAINFSLAETPQAWFCSSPIMPHASRQITSLAYGFWLVLLNKCCKVTLHSSMYVILVQFLVS
jgi:hypothetical protein